MGLFAGTGSAIISGLAGLGSSIFSGIGAGKRQKKEHKHRTQLAEYAYDKDLEMWNRANEYNSPEQQMKRYRDAGLNPMLLQGDIANTAVGNLPQYQQPEINYNAPTTGEMAGEALGSFVGNAMEGQQLNLQRQAFKRNEIRIGIDELKLEREKINLALERDHYNPMKVLEYAETTKQLRQRQWEYERTDGSSKSFYQHNRTVNYEMNNLQYQVKHVDGLIKKEIEKGKILANEYNDFINQITVRQGIDPRETPMFRRLLRQIDQIENVDVREFVTALVMIGGLVFGK